jgi:type I restriction enzyme M protein
LIVKSNEKLKRVREMLTGEIRSQVDRVWMAIYTGGISNPLEVVEQLTYLLFLKRLDEMQTLEENKAARLNKPIERVIFPQGEDLKGRTYQDIRWSRLKNLEPQDMYNVVSEHAFPFLRELGGDGSTYSKHMQGARFTLPTPALLAKVVDMLDEIQMDDRDTKGDIYEYMLGKIASAGQNGQFRTPRHIIQLLVELTAPQPKDTICDPASGTCGFLVAASEYIRKHHSTMLVDPVSAKHFNSTMFHGYDFDNTMLRIGSMNMLLHGVESPEITYRDSLSQDYAVEEEKYSLILANPPFAGSLDYDTTAKDLLNVVKTKKTELLFLALFLKLLKPGGRAAVIIPDGVLFGSSKAHKDLRRMLVEEQKLEAVISLPSGVFKPYAGVSTAVLIFTKTNSGGTENVWFYDMLADGWSLNDQRQPLLDEEKLGVRPLAAIVGNEHEKNNLPDLLRRWNLRESSELSNSRAQQSFTVPASELAANNYDLSINKYKELEQELVVHKEPSVLINELLAIEEDLRVSLVDLEELLK